MRYDFASILVLLNGPLRPVYDSKIGEIGHLEDVVIGLQYMLREKHRC